MSFLGSFNFFFFYLITFESKIPEQVKVCRFKMRCGEGTVDMEIKVHSAESGVIEGSFF